MENATKQARLERPAAAFDPVMKGHAGDECNKTRILYPKGSAPNLTVYCKPIFFGTPIQTEASGVGRPKGVSPGQTLVPDDFRVCFLVSPHVSLTEKRWGYASPWGSAKGFL
jgi:hypothetical protein